MSESYSEDDLDFYEENEASWGNDSLMLLVRMSDEEVAELGRTNGFDFEDEEENDE